MSLKTVLSLKSLKFDNDFILFVKYFHKCMKRFGIKRIENKLTELYSSTDNNQHDLIKKKIFDEISVIYGISKKMLLTSNKRGYVTEAKVMAILLLYKHLNISQADIAQILGRGQTTISRRIKSFNMVFNNSVALYKNEEHFAKIYANNNFINNFKLIDEKILNYVRNIK